MIACSAGPLDAAPYIKRQVERRLVDRGILAYLGIRLPWEHTDTSAAIPQEGAVGAACGGTLLPQCSPIYLNKLPDACRTCRGPN